MPLLKAVIALATIFRHPGLEDSARLKATAKKQCKSVSQLAWTVGIRKGPEVEMLTDRRQRLFTALAEQVGAEVSGGAGRSS